MLDKSQIKKVLKVLLRKSKGLGRLKRIEEMDRGLSALNFIGEGGWEAFLFKNNVDKGLCIAINIK